MTPHTGPCDDARDFGLPAPGSTVSRVDAVTEYLQIAPISTEPCPIPSSIHAPESESGWGENSLPTRRPTRLITDPKWGQISLPKPAQCRAKPDCETHAELAESSVGALFLARVSAVVRPLMAGAGEPPSDRQRKSSAQGTPKEFAKSLRE